MVWGVDVVKADGVKQLTYTSGCHHLAFSTQVKMLIDDRAKYYVDKQIQQRQADSWQPCLKPLQYMGEKCDSFIFVLPQSATIKQRYIRQLYTGSFTIAL
jgi:hypothetical protein